jgi:hypothetical protein
MGSNDSRARMKPTHAVEYFDSFKMQNTVTLGLLKHATISDDPDHEDMATVEIENPVRKTIRVPLTCLTELHTGKRCG